MDVTHPEVLYLKFILGGKQFSYPGFNGVFTKVQYNIGTGAFVDTLENVNALLAKVGTYPPFLWDKLVTVN